VAAVVVAAAADAGMDQKVGLLAELDLPAAGQQPGQEILPGIKIVPEAGEAEAERRPGVRQARRPGDREIIFGGHVAASVTGL